MMRLETTAGCVPVFTDSETGMIGWIPTIADVPRSVSGDAASPISVR